MAPAPLTAEFRKVHQFNVFTVNTPMQHALAAHMADVPTLKEAFAKAALVSCVKLARELGLRVVAEGVETQAMWDFMKWLGVDEAQGFFLSKPLPPAEFAELLKQG